MNSLRYALLSALILGLGFCPGWAWAWGYEGHEVVAAIASAYLKPEARSRIDSMLAADADTLVGHDMLAASTWADRYRAAGHPETGSWHFVDIELDRPNLEDACFGFPAAGTEASLGPADDCIVNKLQEFIKELGSVRTSPGERLLALKYVLHFVGDIHQPLHAADNHDKGGNCVLLNLGGPRAVNLHSYWDTVVVQELGPDAPTLAQTLIQSITKEDKASWTQGDPTSWALDSFRAAQNIAYTIGSKPGCPTDSVPISLPTGYDAAARRLAAVQLRKAGVRLAMVLNRAF